VRWEHPERGMLPPDEFIPVAEETGLVVYMDMWMFQEACRLSVEWEKTLGRPVRIAVNFASRQYYRSNLVSSLREILDKTGARPENIGIEITETGIMTDFERATTILSELKKTGFSLNIDDFGTGYSSLAYLRQFPVDALKIDKSFIDHILTDQQTAVLVKTIITMAHSLGMKVIAEGVESILQKNFLEENRCDLIQGYLVSKPIPTDKVIDFLNTYSSS
jgi:EAL domain-containing protein (putative c-di-GMP-specific phosphodiesterase class I)